MSRHYEIKDYYYDLAKQKGFKARSVFKLQEIQKKYKIIKPNHAVLDIGCFPGSFLQVLSHWVGKSGKVIGFDIKKTPDLGFNNVKTFVADINDIKEINEQLNNLTIEQFNVIISDIAPNTTGNPDYDQYQSILLNEKVLKLASANLKTGGDMILKIFQGSDFNDFLVKSKQNFKKIKLFKPKASRARSKEIYLLCFDLRK